MDAFKTILMGCGALAMLSVVGCVGLVGVGSYAVGEAIEEEQLRQATSKGGRPSHVSGSRSNSNSRYDDDPFSDYSSDQSYDAAGERVGGWGDEAQ